LANRYSTQSPVVLNDGVAGESVYRYVGTPPMPPGVIRLPGVLSQEAGQVLLLQEGVNDVNSGDLTVIPLIVNGLTTMIREARGRGMQVFLGTLLPERAGGCRAFAPQLIPPANDRIRALAASEGAVLVDLYQAFAGMETVFLGEDGLHPNETGYQKIAQTFFDSIRQRLEVSQQGAHLGELHP
jgi:lysophospholipase L1-like esterase